jgi:hypothetical protein
MTLRIETAIAVTFAIVFVCASAPSAKAETNVGNGKPHRPHKYATVGGSVQPHDRKLSWTPVWGAPPLQDRRDAYHGYFANPIDSSEYYGSAIRR